MNQNKQRLIIVGIALFIAIIIIIAFFPIVVVGAGERGVVFNNTTGVENRILGEGVHFRVPLIENVVIMPVRTQISTYAETGADSAGTSDSQQVDIKVSVNWHLNAGEVNKIYQRVGDIDAIATNVLDNNTKDSIKAAVSKYVALDVQKNRDNVATTALNVLQTKMKQYYVVIDNLSITNINFSDKFNQAIEDAQVANQHAIAAENEVKTAQANAQATVATAQGQADAQKLLQQTLTSEILQKLSIEKWNGELPTYLGAGTPIPFLNLTK